jgi:hypothetical protein
MVASSELMIGVKNLAAACFEHTTEHSTGVTDTLTKSVAVVSEGEGSPGIVPSSDGSEGVGEPSLSREDSGKIRDNIACTKWGYSSSGMCIRLNRQSCKKRTDACKQLASVVGSPPSSDNSETELLWECEIGGRVMPATAEWRVQEDVLDQEEEDEDLEVDAIAGYKEAEPTGIEEKEEEEGCGIGVLTRNWIEALM